MPTTQPAINPPGDPPATALDDRILFAEDTKEVEALSEIIIMRNSRGQRFVCSIPEAKPPSKRDVEEKEDWHELEKRAVEKGLQLLEPLSGVTGKECLYYVCIRPSICHYHQNIFGALRRASLIFPLTHIMYILIASDPRLVDLRVLSSPLCTPVSSRRPTRPGTRAGT